MAGRGRGRGRGALNIDAITSKPGITQSNDDDIYNELTQKVNQLDVNATDVDVELRIALNFISTDENIDKLLKLFLGRCNEDWHYAKVIGTLCYEMDRDERKGQQFRTMLLKTIQGEYKNKEELRDESLSQFMGSMSLICQVFAQLRSARGEPFMPLIKPVLSVIEMMLDVVATDQELDCGVTQLSEILSTLYICSAQDKLKPLLETLREAILDARGPRSLRKKMLELLEDNASR